MRPCLVLIRSDPSGNMCLREFTSRILLLSHTYNKLIYLIVVVASGKAAVPVISLAMIGAVYGLQVGTLEGRH